MATNCRKTPPTERIKSMQIQVTYSEQELTEVLKCSKRRIEELRKMGVLQGVKTAKGYVYHNDEIAKFFEKWKGKELP